MSLGELFWLFVFLGAVQPVLARRLLEAMRARKIAEIERRRGSRVILLVHRQETMSLLGFPLMRYIDVEDSEAVLRAIQLTERELPIDLVLHTPGGLVLAASQIARALADHPGKVTVFVPHYAMSGGTLIALAADEIVMSRHAVLGPIDPQIRGLPAASLVRVLEQKPLSAVDDETLVLADIGERALDQVEALATALLSRRMEPTRATETARLLARGTWTHDFPITADAATALGLPVTTDIPADVLQLMTLYPQPVRASGGVEYRPVPRGRERLP